MSATALPLPGADAKDRRLTVASEWVRAIRGRQTQSEFAADVGVSHPLVISRWENGRSLPCRFYRRRLAVLAAERGIKNPGEYGVK